MKILLWNPMAATFAARWACILTQLGSIQVAAFPGTKQVLPQYLHSDETVFKERILGCELFHWPCADAKFSSISTGVTIAARRHADDLPQRFFTFCPPSELQGRAGALVDTGRKNLTLHLCVYLPDSGSSTFVAQCDRQLFEWAQQIIDKHNHSTNHFLYTDANAKLGWVKSQGDLLRRQNPTVVGPLAQEFVLYNPFGGAAGPNHLVPLLVG